MLFEVFLYLLLGQVVSQVFPSKKFKPEQVKQLLFDDPEQVKHEASQESQVLLVLLENFPDGQVPIH